MNITIVTEYTKESLTAMAHAVRIVMNKTTSMVSRGIAVVLIAVGIYTIFPRDGVLELRYSSIFMLLAMITVGAFLLLEDRNNGRSAYKTISKSMTKSRVVFSDDAYRYVFDKSAKRDDIVMQYNRISKIALYKHWIVFLFSMTNAEIFDLDSISEDEKETFLRFIAEKTGAEIQTIK